MRTSNSLLLRLGALGLVIAGVVIFAGACESGGNEGWKCNPLVLQDECHSGLRCTPATCSEAYCCPTNGSSNDPHCKGVEGCPDPDAGDEGGADAAEASVADSASETGSDASADADASDADASDAAAD